MDFAFHKKITQDGDRRSRQFLPDDVIERILFMHDWNMERRDFFVEFFDFKRQFARLGVLIEKCSGFQNEYAVLSAYTLDRKSIFHERHPLPHNPRTIKKFRCEKKKRVWDKEDKITFIICNKSFCIPRLLFPSDSYFGILIKWGVYNVFDYPHSPRLFSILVAFLQGELFSLSKDDYDDFLVYLDFLNISIEKNNFDGDYVRIKGTDEGVLDFCNQHIFYSRSSLLSFSALRKIGVFAPKNYRVYSMPDCERKKTGIYFEVHLFDYGGVSFGFVSSISYYKSHLFDEFFERFGLTPCHRPFLNLIYSGECALSLYL